MAVSLLPKAVWLQPEQLGRASRDWSDITKGANKPQHQHPNHGHMTGGFHHRMMPQQQQHRGFDSRSLQGIPAEYLAMALQQGGGMIQRPLQLQQQHSTRPAPPATQTTKILGSRENRASVLAADVSVPSSLTREYGGTPWRPKTKRYSPGVVGLHEEIEDFYQYMTPRPAETQMRKELVDRIATVIRDKFPGITAEYFGSFRTGLFLPTSDIDMVLLGDWKGPQGLFQLKEELIKADICLPDGVKVLDKASVPIIKLTDRRTDVKVDISVNMKTGPSSAELILEYMHKHACLAKLVLVLKQFLLQRDLNEVFTGGISSYSLILMTVSFLQMHPRYNQSDKEPNLAVLLIEFFEFYGRHFNYMEVAIRVKEACYIKKEEMERTMPEGLTASVLCIEDPLQPGNDIGRSSYGALQVKHAYEYAYLQLSHAVFDDGGFVDTDADGDPCPPSILGRIIRITDEVIDYRAWVDKNYGGGDLKENTKSYASVARGQPRRHDPNSQSSCGSSAVSSSSFDTQSVSSRDSAQSSMGDSDGELENLTQNSDRLQKDSKSASSVNPPHERPGSAPPAGLIRKPVATRDAAVQINLQTPSRGHKTNSITPSCSTTIIFDADSPSPSTTSTPSECGSSQRALSPGGGDEIKVVSFNESIPSVSPVPPTASASSTRSLDGSGPAERNYKGALTSNTRAGGHLATVRTSLSSPAPEMPATPSGTSSGTSSMYYPSGSGRGGYGVRRSGWDAANGDGEETWAGTGRTFTRQTSAREYGQYNSGGGATKRGKSRGGANTPRGTWRS